MFEEARVFLERFRETTMDVVVRRSADEILRAAEFVLVVGTFGVLADHFGSVAASIAYWVTLITFSIYSGSRTSYFLSGAIRGRGRHERWHDWVIFPASVVVSVAFAYGTKMLIDAVIAAKGAV